MQFPFKPQHTFHKHGGKIILITGIGHEVERPQDGYSKDYWFYTGRMKWDDTGRVDVSDHRIYAHDLCADDKAGHDEINMISEAMMAYLNEHGEWYDSKPHQGWYANVRTERQKRVTA